MVLNTNMHLGNAPITEAMIDIRIKELPETELESLADSHEDIRSTYPLIKPIHHQSYQLKFDETGDLNADSSSDFLGYRYECESPPRVLQYRTNGFTLSFLKPYSSWNELRDEAKIRYQEYISSINCDTYITRIALRFINHFILPLPCNFDEYFTAPPKIPENLSQELINYVSQNTVNFPETGSIGRIVQSTSGTINEHEIPIILDIDVFKEMNPVLKLNDQSIWEEFEKLRVLKNEIFFGSITNKTLERYV